MNINEHGHMYVCTRFCMPKQNLYIKIGNSYSWIVCITQQTISSMMPLLSKTSEQISASAIIIMERSTTDDDNNQVLFAFAGERAVRWSNRPFWLQSSLCWQTITYKYIFNIIYVQFMIMMRFLCFYCR